MAGGTLNLKRPAGVEKRKETKKKRKPKSNKDAIVKGTEHQASQSEGAHRGAQSTDSASAGQTAAPKTPAQLKHAEWLAKREAERLSKAASKSHREKIQEYNDKLSKLSEHNDIPKVGPG